MGNYPTLHLAPNQSEQQLVVRKDMDVNAHEKQSNFTLRHKIK